MRNIAIIGFGVLGKQILNFLNEAGQINEVMLFDDTIFSSSNEHLALPTNQYKSTDFKEFDFYIGIGYKHLGYRKKIISELRAINRNLPALIHPSCYVSSYASISSACILFPKCNIDQNVTIAEGNILHNSVTISHDSSIGKCNYFSPSVTICGNTKVGTETFVGAGTTISNGVNVGDCVRVGIGSAINKDVASGLSVIGNPQRTLQSQLNIC